MQCKRNSVLTDRVNPYPGGGCTKFFFELKPDSGNVSSSSFRLAEIQDEVLRFALVIFYFFVENRFVL